MPSWITASASVAAGAALMLSGLATTALLRCRRELPQDAPNGRSLHVHPVPRVGGVAIWAGFVPVALWRGADLPGAGVWWAGWAAVLLVSLLDDWRGVHPAARLAVQLAAAATACAAIAAAAHGGPEGWGIILAATLAVVWSANAFNFMDGSDGLAALMTLVGFIVYGAGAAQAGARPDVYWALAAAAIPFAVVNWPPARMFMGDGGAVPLGFLAAFFGIGEWLRGTWPGWFPLLAFLPFLADATLTLVGRLRRRERIWEAHRGHYYQRHHRLGGSHGGTLRLYGVLMLGAGASAVLTLALEPAAGWAVLAMWCAVHVIVFLRIDYHWRRQRPLTTG